MDAPTSSPVKLPKNKQTLVIGGVAAAAVLYWWWHRAPAVPTPDTSLTPSTSPDTRDPGPGASGDSTGAATTPAANGPVDDTAWAQQALSTMTARGFEPTLVSSITGKWLSQEPITSGKEIAMVAVMLPIVGYPPSGLHPQLGNTAPSPTPTPTPTPVPGGGTWSGPLVRKAKGGGVLKVRVPFKSAWEWWVVHEYTNLPPDEARRKAAAAKLKAANAWRGRDYKWDTVSPPQTLDIPAALYV